MKPWLLLVEHDHDDAEKCLSGEASLAALHQRLVTLGVEDAVELVLLDVVVLQQVHLLGVVRFKLKIGKFSNSKNTLGGLMTMTIDGASAMYKMKAAPSRLLQI